MSALPICEQLLRETKFRIRDGGPVHTTEKNPDGRKAAALINELYEALEKLTEASDACDPRYEESPGALQELSNAARHVLAKARGEAL